MRVLIDLWMKIYDLCMERSVKARACVRKLLKYNYKQPQRNIWWKLFHSVDFQLSISLEWKQWIYANLLFKNVEKRAHTQTHMVLSRYPTSYIHTMQYTSIKIYIVRLDKSFLYTTKNCRLYDPMKY